MKQMILGLILGMLGTAAIGSYALTPERICRNEAGRVWNEATIQEHIDLQRDDRVTLSEDGRNAAWWMAGCRTGIALQNDV